MIKSTNLEMKEVWFVSGLYHLQECPEKLAEALETSTPLSRKWDNDTSILVWCQSQQR